MSTSGTFTPLSVVDAHDHSGGTFKALQHDGCTVPALICRQSSTLHALLDTAGHTTLPLPPSQFRAWLDFAASPDAPSPRANGCDVLSSTARLIEVSQFMRNAATEARAASCTAMMLRRAYRRDLMHTHTPGTADTLTFPPAVLARPGKWLQAATAALPPLPAAAVAAVVRYLTLCEALLLPAPFPAEALANYLTTTGGVLDLSPPRVPTHTPASLAAISKLLGPLLSRGTPLTALHLPGPCMARKPPLSQLLPRLNTLTRLCITHGNTAYSDGDASTQPPLHAEAAAAALERLSPATLRHLTIDPLLDPNANPVHRLLCSFTALTSLRLSTAPRALTHMPALATLTLTHLPPKLSSIDAQGRMISEATSLQRIHASGADSSVARVYQSFSGHRLGLPVPAGSRAIPPITTFMGRLDPDTANDVYSSIDGTSEDVFCCGFPFPGCGVSLQHDRVAHRGVATSLVHFFRYRFLSGVWGPEPRSDDGCGGAECAPPRQVLLSGGGPAELCELTLGTRAHSPEVLALARNIMLAEVPHQLGVLCVLRIPDLPPQSALCAAKVRRPCPADIGSRRSRCGRRPKLFDSFGGEWVTARPSGVAHPLCALEMLHYNSAPLPTEPPAEGVAAWPNDPAPVSGALHTLRLSEDAFLTLQELVLADAPLVSCLCDLSLLSAPGRETKPDPQLNLSCLSRLTSLRTLALQGLRGVCTAPRRLHLPPALTALLLHGSDDLGKPAAAAAFGPPLLRLPDLQCLDVEIVVLRRPRSPFGADAVPAMRRGLWEGLRPALLQLPLHLGARVTLTESVYGLDDAFPCLS